VKTTNCDGIDDCLVLGTPFSALGEEHLRTCTSCSTIIEVLSAKPLVSDEEHLSSIRGLLTASLRPVRPLPSDPTLILLALVSFLAFSLLATVPVDYRGFHHLSTIQRLAYYATIALSAVLFSAAVVQEIIPGARRRLTPGLIVAFSLLSLVVVSVGLFPNFGLDHFVKIGVPCLRLGIVCAAVGGFLAYFLLRKGFASSPVRATTITGFFAGLAGVAVLALHCPVQNAAHMMVWHLGAMTIAGAGGALIGFLQQRLAAR